jgi:ribonucleotide monophosphatase NagD (HAD superfamily)
LALLLYKQILDSQKVQLFDRWGQLLLNLTINGTTAIVDNSLPNGIYFIKITNKSGSIMKRLVVSK